MSTSPTLSVSDPRDGPDRLSGRRTGSAMNTGENGLFGPQFIQQLLAAARPHLEALIKEVLSEKRDLSSEVLCVDYEEAGRMIGTSYEGIRKLVRKGRITSVSRSGRHRGVAVDELRSYIERNKVKKQ
jgi:hypothetical protein